MKPSGCTLRGTTWRCNTCGTALAIVDVDARRLTFKRHTRVLVETYDFTADDAGTLSDPIEEVSRIALRGDEVNGTPFAAVDQVDTVTWILCGRCKTTDSLEQVGADPRYWTRFPPGRSPYD